MPTIRNDPSPVHHEHVTGFTIREIAEAHEISAARAGELVYRARLELREALGHDGVAPDSWR